MPNMGIFGLYNAKSQNIRYSSPKSAISAKVQEFLLSLGYVPDNKIVKASGESLDNLGATW